MKKFALLCAAGTVAMPGAAWAQSTGTVDFEDEGAIVITGSRVSDVGGVEAPQTSRSRAALGSEFIQRQVPGQSINDVINSLPGVSFQNNDPYGSAGGTLTIRGFDSTRISQTFDGVPLNDSGNYALYSNQQLDPELITQVNVSLGSTDVDSPTAAASGSTVNYRTRVPFEDFRIRLQGSVGEYGFFRTFGVIDTGAIGPWGTRAFVAASMSTNDNVFNDYGQIYKQQYNARIYQPIGSNGDFISIAGHYNQNRNNFFGSVGLREDGAIGTPGSAPRRFPATRDERFYTLTPCTINTAATPGVADLANGCGSPFDYRWNPSNTGNVRINSRFTLADGLILTVDPSFQYVKANGGGTTVGQEGFFTVGGTPQTGYFINSATSTSNVPYFGRDLNGDGDLLDTIRVATPSQTQTNRYGIIASLRYNINEAHSLRLAYSYDRARHRQTGEIAFLELNGNAPYFPVNNPLTDAGGNVLQKRDRLSFATLHQIAGEYRGEFIDGRLVVNAGLRAPFFTRDLNQNCFTFNSNGGVTCFGTNTAGEAAYSAANPNVQGPQQRVLKYDEILPSVGFVFEAMPRLSIFSNYSRGLQVPGTDNLYNSFFYAPNNPNARPEPETTDNFDLGFRYRRNNVIAQLSGWYTIFNDRLASSYDPDENATIYRNLGRVDKYGIDGYISWQAMPELQLYVFGSYLWSSIRDNVQLSGGGAVSCGRDQTSAPAGCALTAGRRESGAPVYTFGARAQGNLGPIELGVQFKRTGPRYVNDQNLPLLQTVSGVPNTIVFPARAPAYNIVDLDIRVPLEWAGLNDQTYFQINVSNLFDELYVGGFGGQLSNTSVPFVQIGSPRAIMGTLVVGF